MIRSLLAALFLAVPSSATPAAEAPVKRTYIYKTVDGIPIRADVYRPDDDKVRPVVV